ncbi:unnamed protein product [Camellia sinensis]
MITTMKPSSFHHICGAIFCIRFLFCLLILDKTKAAPTYQYSKCPNTTTYTPNSTYETNLKTLLSVLSSNSTTTTNGFSNYTAGHSPPDTANGLFLCRGDVSTDVCRDCVTTATKDVLQKCPNSKVVTIWYDECILRYSNQSILSIDDKSGPLILINIENITDPNRFRDVLGGVLNDIVTRASNNLSGKKFATKEANFTSLQKLYGLAQCIPDISSLDCNTCLRKAISSFQNCCDGRKGARALYSGCTFRYETYPFYTTAAIAAAPPPSLVLPPPPPPPPPASPTGPSISPGKGGISSQVLIAIIVPVGASVLLFITGFCFLRRKAKKKHDDTKEDSAVNEITTVESLQYDFGTIQAATNNFSDDNKIGEGGFGHVYKGKLINGEEIAVKRLSQNSGQGGEEFKNEVLLVAKLQHRNLVRLRGFCLEGEEKILIYEFMPNKSLDRILFDSQEHGKLDWPKRYKIIEGIARGMLYLHEDSQLRIIHRDLKASNILLDGTMNAKISDFGMARIFGVDQSQGNTNRVVGTFYIDKLMELTYSGYMSPEYAMHGQFSVKSDVYSFGVLVLEIISGKKINDFDQSNNVQDLLTYAWKLWKNGTPLKLMDPTLEVSYSRNEVSRCIHIGLLCVQEDPDARPSMATVVLMLNSYTITLAIPEEPAFFSPSKTELNIGQGVVSDQSTRKGGISSQVLIAIIVPVGASVLLFIIGFCFLRRKAKTKRDDTKEDSAVNEITTVESLQYDFGTIQAATNNFSDDNKIGEGGFGHVYKGKLINGEEIAVKRLSQNSGQGGEEFKNEVLLVAKLQHRNLVRLRGFCLEGKEKILIYEFMPNKSLDRILFDSQEHGQLDWPKRYKIIEGIARGMLYLHEDS